MADSYAALNPPDGLWRAYLAEIGRLESRGDIAPEDYYALRFTMAAKTALVDLGDSGESIGSTVPEILARTKAAIRTEIEQTVQKDQGPIVAAGEAFAARAELATLRHEAQAGRARRNERINAYAAYIGRFVSRLVMLLGSLAVAVVAYLGSSPVLPEFPDQALDPYRPILYVIGFFVLALAIANTVLGTSLRSISRQLEVRLTRSSAHWLEQRFP